jgi:glyoxylase-like metal-dependent hydrolase (beta-lactamase superfamily II)
VKTGKYQIDVLQEGRMLVDGGTAFAGLPRSEWEAFASPDTKNRIQLGINFVLIRGEGLNILVDTGIGRKFKPSRLQMMGMENSLSAVRQIERFGLSADDITHVIFTHLHFDHCGGSTEFVGEETTAVFRKAALLVQRDEWQAACTPDEFSRSSYHVHDFMPLLETGNLKLINGDYEIADGISLEVSGGHTAAHQIVKVKDSLFNFIYPADICPTPLHIMPKRHEAFDLYPLETLRARNTLLRRASRPNTLLAFSHAQSAEFYRIEQENGSYKAVKEDDNAAS